MARTMTFCGSVEGKEKLGYKEELFCPYKIYQDYKDRVLASGGVFEAEQCTNEFIINFE